MCKSMRGSSGVRMCKCGRWEWSVCKCMRADSGVCVCRHVEVECACKYVRAESGVCVCKCVSDSSGVIV